MIYVVLFGVPELIERCDLRFTVGYVRSGCFGFWDQGSVLGPQVLMLELKIRG